MSGVSRAPGAEASFTDAEGDGIRLVAEVQGSKGRVSLYHNGNFFKFVTGLVFTETDKKLFVNGHEATIELTKEQVGEVLEKIRKVCEVGMVVFTEAETIDAAAELAKVRQAEADALADEMREEGISEDMITKTLQAQNKKQSERKRVPAEALEQLQSMGYSEAVAKRAFAFCDGTTLELALAWLEKHQDDANREAPVDPAKLPIFTKPLTEEEKALKAEELQKKMDASRAEKKEKERLRQLELEKKRRADGKSEQVAKEEYAKKKRMEAYEERRRAKAEDLKAKQAIREQINADRIAKGWDPLPDVEEKKVEKQVSAEEFFKKQETTKPVDDDWDPMALNPAAATSEPVKETAVPIPTGEGLPRPGIDLDRATLEAAVRKIKATPKTLETLTAYISNIVSDPFNPKYRTIRTNNSIFKKHIRDVPDAIDPLLLFGFRPADDRLNIRTIHIPTAALLLSLLKE